MVVVVRTWFKLGLSHAGPTQCGDYHLMGSHVWGKRDKYGVHWGTILLKK